MVWRCHIGLDQPNAVVRHAWDFLRPYVREAHAYVFSRAAYRWEGLEEAKTVVIPPGIDAFSCKNQELEPDTVASVLRVSGLLGGPAGLPVFHRPDGSEARVQHRARTLQPPPGPTARSAAAGGGGSAEERGGGLRPHGE